MGRVLTLVLALWALPLWAQEPGDEQAPAADSQPADGNEVPGGEASTPENPFDYEASEQISEDLPVSFPVDI